MCLGGLLPVWISPGAFPSLQLLCGRPAEFPTGCICWSHSPRAGKGPSNPLRGWWECIMETTPVQESECFPSSNCNWERLWLRWETHSAVVTGPGAMESIGAATHSCVLICMKDTVVIQDTLPSQGGCRDSMRKALFAAPGAEEALPAALMTRYSPCYYGESLWADQFTSAHARLVFQRISPFLRCGEKHMPLKVRLPRLTYVSAFLPTMLLFFPVGFGTCPSFRQVSQLRRGQETAGARRFFLRGGGRGRCSFCTLPSGRLK